MSSILERRNTFALSATRGSIVRIICGSTQDLILLDEWNLRWQLEMGPGCRRWIWTATRVCKLLEPPPTKTFGNKKLSGFWLSFGLVLNGFSLIVISFLPWVELLFYLYNQENVKELFTQSLYLVGTRLLFYSVILCLWYFLTIYLFYLYLNLKIENLKAIHTKISENSKKK